MNEYQKSLNTIGDALTYYNVQIKLNVTVSDTENSNSCNIVDSLLNDIWNIALGKEGVEAQSMSSKYMKEKIAK